MTKGQSLAICRNIKSDDYDPEIKLIAIQDMLQLDTHNGVSKQTMLDCLEWIVEEYI